MTTNQLNRPTDGLFSVYQMTQSIRYTFVLFVPLGALSAQTVGLKHNIIRHERKILLRNTNWTTQKDKAYLEHCRTITGNVYLLVVMV